MPKTLSAFMDKFNIRRRVGDRDPVIEGITYDSRRVAPGSLFFALDGLHTDGHRHIADALGRGAAAVVHSRPLESYRDGVSYLEVDSPRSLLSAAAAEFYDHPSRRVDVIGVTGTDGKSTTVFFIHQLLDLLGLRSGFLSTVQILTAAEPEKNPYRQSTPEASEVQAILAEMIDHGKEVVVLEATSHGLSRRTSRLADVQFRAGVLTNISHEHLEFHGTLEQYVSDKANLFRSLSGKAAFGVVNGGDVQAPVFRGATTQPVFSYGTDQGTDLSAQEVRSDAEGIDFTIAAAGERYPTRLNLPGLFNVENALASVLAVWKYTGRPLSEIAPLVPSLRSTVGRMRRIERGQDFAVIVDYAHTPGAFTRLLPAMKRETRGRLITLFGSAGERDREKRAIQGKIADEYADLIVLTDEDPRGEPGEEILAEIAGGMSGRVDGTTLFQIPDRREAIRQALSLARAGDTVLLLGKGHEGSIIYADGPMAWDEIAVAAEELGRLGFSAPDRAAPR